MTEVTEAPKTFTAAITVTQEALALARRAEGSVEIAKSLVIDSAEMANEAMEEIRTIKARHKKLKELRDGFVAPAKQIMENAAALFNPALTSLEQAERTIKGALTTWDEQERQRQAEERRKAEAAAAELRRQAEAAAAAERARAEAEAAEKRRQAEVEARRAREANDAEAAARAAELQAQAASIEEKAAEKVETLHLEAAAAAPTVIAESTRPEGFHTRDKWEGEVLDLSKAIVAIAQRPEYHSLLKIDQAALNRIASATKGAVKLDGIQFVCKKTPVARA